MSNRAVKKKDNWIEIQIQIHIYYYINDIEFYGILLEMNTQNTQRIDYISNIEGKRGVKLKLN